MRYLSAEDGRQKRSSKSLIGQVIDDRIEECRCLGEEWGYQSEPHGDCGGVEEHRPQAEDRVRSPRQYEDYEDNDGHLSGRQHDWHH